MKCGEEIRIIDINGSYVMRFGAGCNDQFLVIAGPAKSYMNGIILMSWKDVLREMICLTVPMKLERERYQAQSSTNNMYHAVSLTYPLSAAQLADMFGVPAEEVQAQLRDWSVPYSE